MLAPYGLASFRELARIRRLVHDLRHATTIPLCPFCPVRTDGLALRYRAEVPVRVAP